MSRVHLLISPGTIYLLVAVGMFGCIPIFLEAVSDQIFGVASKHEKLCQQDLDLAASYLEGKSGLIAHQVTTTVEPGQAYIISPRVSGSFLPSQPRYPSQFFERLVTQKSSMSPPLVVVVKMVGPSAALVVSNCSPKPFKVKKLGRYDFYKVQENQITSIGN